MRNIIDLFLANICAKHNLFTRKQTFHGSKDIKGYMTPHKNVRSQISDGLYFRFIRVHIMSCVVQKLNVVFYEEDRSYANFK